MLLEVIFLIGSLNTILVALVPKDLTSLTSGYALSIGVNSKSLATISLSPAITVSTVNLYFFWFVNTFPASLSFMFNTTVLPSSCRTASSILMLLFIE